jgi:hypothetical protein
VETAHSTGGRDRAQHRRPRPRTAQAAETAHSTGGRDRAQHRRPRGRGGRHEPARSMAQLPARPRRLKSGLESRGARAPPLKTPRARREVARRGGGRAFGKRASHEGAPWMGCTRTDGANGGKGKAGQDLLAAPARQAAGVSSSAARARRARPQARGGRRSTATLAGGRGSGRGRGRCTRRRVRGAVCQAPTGAWGPRPGARELSGAWPGRREGAGRARVCNAEVAGVAQGIKDVALPRAAAQRERAAMRGRRGASYIACRQWTQKASRRRRARGAFGGLGVGVQAPLTAAAARRPAAPGLPQQCRPPAPFCQPLDSPRPSHAPLAPPASRLGAAGRQGSGSSRRRDGRWGQVRRGGAARMYALGQMCWAARGGIQAAERLRGEAALGRGCMAPPRDQTCRVGRASGRRCMRGECAAPPAHQQRRACAWAGRPAARAPGGQKT